jgi:hypothetical protein
VTLIATVVAGGRLTSIGLVAAAALAAVIALSRAHGRRLERRMAAELGPHEVTPTAFAPESAPTPIGAEGIDRFRRDPELRITLDELIEQRDHLLEVYQRVQDRIQRAQELEHRNGPAPQGPPSNVIVLRDRAVRRHATPRRREPGGST